MYKIMTLISLLTTLELLPVGASISALKKSLYSDVSCVLFNIHGRKQRWDVL